MNIQVQKNNISRRFSTSDIKLRALYRRIRRVFNVYHKLWYSENRQRGIIIRRFDKQYPIGVDKDNENSQRLYNDGIVKLTLPSMNDTLADKLIRTLDTHGPQSGKGTVILTDFCNYPIFLEFPELNEILTDVRLVQLASSYLGPETRLNEISLIKTTANLSQTSRQTVSSAWHTDHIGHQLKLFVYLNSPNRGRTTPTQYAIGTNRSPYRFGYFNQHRTMFVDENVVNETAELIAKRKKWNVATVSGRVGEALLFDVCGYHRGLRSGEQLEDRYHLQIDFANRKKVNSLNYFNSEARVRLPLDLDCSAALIDPEKLRKDGNTLIYQVASGVRTRSPGE